MALNTDFEDCNKYIHETAHCHGKQTQTPSLFYLFLLAGSLLLQLIFVCIQSNDIVYNMKQEIGKNQPEYSRLVPRKGRMMLWRVPFSLFRSIISLEKGEEDIFRRRNHFYTQLPLLQRTLVQFLAQVQPLFSLYMDFLTQ